MPTFPDLPPEPAPRTLWNAELLRLTVFPDEPPPVEEPPWWNELVGEELESYKVQKREAAYEAQGPFAGGNLLLRVGALRVDWLFVPSPPDDPLRRLEEVLGPFQDLAQIWLPLAASAVQRLAFGCVLSSPVEDRATGYLSLNPMLPAVDIDVSGNSTDFFYQINRPRASRVEPSIRLNRLAKWSVVLRQSLQINAPQGRAAVGSSDFAIRLELDMNTAPEHEHLPRERLPDLFDELISLGLEIAAEGDTP
jgi:hypothetical protein